MSSSPFLTDLDSRAQVKGSRDPLGIQPIWIRFGRHIIGNLTNASNSLRDFTATILGYYFAERVDHEKGSASALATFIKWEQLAVYSRAYINHDLVFRGTERVQARLADGPRVTLSAETHHQILADQKVYGLWGLYSIPSRASGLLENDPARLTPPAREIVEKVYLPILGSAGIKNGDQIVALLCESSPRIDLDGKHAKIAKAVAKMLQKKMMAIEPGFYRDHLLHGGPQDSTSGLQRQFAGLLEKVNGKAGFTMSPASMRALAKEALPSGKEGALLAEKIERIATAESVLAPASRFFGYLLGCADTPIEQIAKHVQGIWGPGLRTIDLKAIQKIGAELGGGVAESEKRWIAISNSLVAGDYAGLIDGVLEQNKAVMAERGGSPWVVKKGKKLDIRFRDENTKLPSRSELSSLWQFPYFITSLLNISDTIYGRDA